MNALSHQSGPPPEFSERRTRETAVRSVSHRRLIDLNGRPILKGCKQAANIKGLEVLLLFDAWYPFLQATITFPCIEDFILKFFFILFDLSAKWTEVVKMPCC